MANCTQSTHKINEKLTRHVIKMQRN